MNYKNICVLLTTKCNFNCEHCGLKKSKKNKSTSIKVINNVLKKSKKRGYKDLMITGGEPLLYFNKVCKIIKLSKKLGFRVALNTNGYFIAYPKPEETIKKLQGIDEIIFSIDQDHLKFISYKILLNTIKNILKNEIFVTIKTANRKKTINKNIQIIKNILRDLNFIPIKIGPLATLSKTEIYYAFSGKKLIRIMSFPVYKTEAQKEKFDIFKTFRFEDFIFMNKYQIDFPCKFPHIFLNENSNFLACCSFIAFNNPKYYSSKILNWNKKTKNQLLNIILQEKFPFLRIFLQIKKDKKLSKLLLLKKYYDVCDACLAIMKYKDKIEKLNSCSKIEMIFMLILNLHKVLYSYLKGLKTELTEYESNIIKKIVKIL